MDNDRDQKRLAFALKKASEAVGIQTQDPGSMRERSLRMWEHIDHDPEMRLNDLKQKIQDMEELKDDGKAGADVVLSSYWLERALPAQRAIAQQARALALGRVPEERVNARLMQLEGRLATTGTLWGNPQKQAEDLPEMTNDELLTALAQTQVGRETLATAFNMHGKKRAAYIAGDIEVFKRAQDDQDQSWIGVDLDGTLAEHKPGEEYKATKIGKPIPRMVNRVKRWIEDGKTVKIFTARADGGGPVIRAIKDWCKEHIGYELEVTNVKDRFCVEIYDDRARQVMRNSGELIEAAIIDDADEPKVELMVEKVESPEDTWTGMAKYPQSPDHGMLFPHAGPLCMRGMEHDLAALFLDPSMRIVDIQVMTADDPTGMRKSYQSADPGACRVLEIPDWMTDLVDFAIGDRLKLGPLWDG